MVGAALSLHWKFFKIEHLSVFFDEASIDLGLTFEYASAM